jgi:rod shape-determining protein MreD
MQGVKITIALIIAILLQWTARGIADPLMYIDFPLIVVVYAALQRDTIKALIFATISGLAIDALSGGLMGASGFSKTLTVFVVAEVARRVFLDNLLLRIPVIAGASILKDLIYFGMHRLMGQPPNVPVFETIAYDVIGTTIAGTLFFFLLESVFTLGRVGKPRRSSGKEYFPRRQGRRRNPIRLGRRRG